MLLRAEVGHRCWVFIRTSPRVRGVGLGQGPVVAPGHLTSCLAVAA